MIIIGIRNSTEKFHFFKYSKLVDHKTIEKDEVQGQKKLESVKILS